MWRETVGDYQKGSSAGLLLWLFFERRSDGARLLLFAFNIHEIPTMLRYEVAIYTCGTLCISYYLCRNRHGITSSNICSYTLITFNNCYWYLGCLRTAIFNRTIYLQQHPGISVSYKEYKYLKAKFLRQGI